jgi:hypothetical protein
MKTIKDYSIISHGIDSPDYFQGCGVCFTKFEDVATGIGNTEFEACEGALESLAQAGWDVSTVVNDCDKEKTVSDCVEVVEGEECDCYFYVSVRVR